MAARNFKPKASSNIIEGATPVEETTVVAPTDEEKEVANTPAPVEEETTAVTSPEVPETETEPETQPETPAPAVTFEDKSTKTPIEKNVKIRTKVNHSCCIGGVRYHFEKGKQTNVPESVKAILLQADLLMPL